MFLYFGRLETFSIFLSMHQEVGIGTYLPTYNAGLVAGLWLSVRRRQVWKENETKDLASYFGNSTVIDFCLFGGTRFGIQYGALLCLLV